MAKVGVKMPGGSSGVTAATTTTDTTNFNNNLSAADDTVQKALDTIDNLVLGGAETDPLAIHKDGSSTTTASIPFAEGLSIADNKSITWNAGKGYTKYNTTLGLLDTELDSTLSGFNKPDWIIRGGLKPNWLTVNSENSTYPGIRGFSDNTTGIGFNSTDGTIEFINESVVTARFWNSDAPTYPNTQFEIAQAGAVGTPSLFFGGDYSTGIYRPSADVLGFSSAGSEKLRIASTGVSLPTLTSNGFLKTSGGNGTLSVDTNTYLTAESDTLASVTGRGASTTVLTQFQNAGGIELGKDDATNTAGVLKMWGAGSNDYYTTFTAGTQTANATYTLPTAMPASTGFLKSTNAGVMSWDTSSYFVLPALTSGSVLFSNGTTIAQDNANFFWDDTNNRLGIGTATPASILHVEQNQNALTQFRLLNTTSGTAAREIILFGQAATGGTYGLFQYLNSGYTTDGLWTAGSTVIATAAGGSNGLILETDADIPIIFATGGHATSNERMRILGTGNVGIGVTGPTAVLHLKAGTATASTAPLKFNSGTLLTTPEAGAVEFLTDKYYGTITTGAARKEFALNDAALTSGSVLFAGSTGRITQDNANLFWDDTNNRLGLGTVSPTNILTIGASTEYAAISRETSDGTDNKYLAFTGGGSLSVDRGAGFISGGNESTTYPGQAVFFGGNVSTGHIKFYTNNFLERLRINYDGTVTMSSSGELNGFVRETADASDNKVMYFSGGGALSVERGSFFQVAGNESATYPGKIVFGAGNVSTGSIDFYTNNFLQRMTILNNGNVGIGQSTPTAVLHLKAGTATASTAPLKFTSGTLLSSAEAGAVEFLTDKFYGTITTGTARKELTLNDAALTSGRVPFVTTNGRLTDDADMTFSTDTLTVAKIVGSTSITDSGLTSGRVTFASTAGLLADSANLTYNSGTGALTVAAGAAQNLMGTGLHINTAGGSTSVYDTQIEGDTDANLLYVDASADKVGFGTNAPTAKVDINSDFFRLRTAKTPASASATGTAGDICWDADYIYVCTATDTWKRSVIATW
jgi:hypothetical protein